MFKITVERAFDAAHFLICTDTACDKIHGHRWTVHCTFAATQLTKQGWVINFTTVKKWVDHILSGLDHNILNFYLPQPTAENLCKCLYYQLHKKCLQYRANNKTDVDIENVQIAETPGNTATFSAYDLQTHSVKSEEFWNGPQGAAWKKEAARRAKEQWGSPEGRKKKIEGIKDVFTQERKESSAEEMRQFNPMRDRQIVEKMMNSLRQAQKLSPNKEEREVIEFMSENNLPFRFVGNGDLIIDGKVPDFVNPKHTIIVEYNNRFWHCDDNPWYDVNDNSTERSKFFAQRGYRTYFIWDDTFANKAGKETILQDLKKLLKEDI